MKYTLLRAGGALGAITMALAAAPVAMAAGTTAGTVITNEATVDYSVGGIAQNQKSATNDVTVDRKVAFTVAETNSAVTNVTPGSTDQAVTFTVTNSSNDVLDFGLLGEDLSNGTTAAHGGSDNFNPGTTPGTFTFYIDDGDGIFNSGSDTLVTFIDELAADTSATIHVVTDSVSLNQVNGDTASVRLTATAQESGAASTEGAVLTAAASNTAGEDTVFADLSGHNDADFDGKFSAIDDFKVLAPELAVTKTSSIVAAADWKADFAVPDGTIRYCIAVANTGSANADNVNISDTLPADVTYVASSAFVSTGSCADTSGTPASESGGVVSAVVNPIAAGTTSFLIFDAKIN